MISFLICTDADSLDFCTYLLGHCSVKDLGHVNDRRNWPRRFAFFKWNSLSWNIEFVKTDTHGEENEVDVSIVGILLVFLKCSRVDDEDTKILMFQNGDRTSTHFPRWNLYLPPSEHALVYKTLPTYQGKARPLPIGGFRSTWNMADED